MSRTRHVQPKMNRIEMKSVIGSLLAPYGGVDGDEFVPTDAESLEALIDRLARLERTAKKILDKGGIVVVSEGDIEITTYNLDSYKRNKH